MPIGPAKMGILEHLGELRRRLVIIVVCLLVSVVLLYFVSPWLVEFLKIPIAEFLPEDGTLYATKAFEGFSLKFFVSLFMSFVICAPVILWQILAFFLPALKPHERKLAIPTFFVGLALFIIGAVFCYSFCLHAAFEWLVGESISISEILPSASDYIKYVCLFIIAFGFAFELPLVVFFLIWFDIVPYKKLRKSWRVAVIVLLVFSAIVTPDASPITMALMFAALFVLYELSIIIARFALGKKIKRLEDEEEE